MVGARLALVLGCVALMACGQGPVTDARPSSAPATPLSLGPCRLPVASGDAPVDGHAGDGTVGHGGFVEFPAARFSPDAASMGDYDRQVSHWLPVSRAWVEPDGARYAWGENSVIHVVDAASGGAHDLPVPAPAAVVSFEMEGIYVARIVPGSGAPAQGLALLDAGSGAFHQIVADGTWTAIGGGFAYGQDLDPALAPPPAAASGPAAANRVRRLDLHSGAVSNVASYPGARAQVLGATGTAPLIGVTSGSTYTVFSGTTTVFTGAAADSDPGAPVVIDGSAVWFSSLNASVWHWDGSGRAAVAATLPLRALQVAGGCH